jgi:hypothetical protein
MSNKPLSWYYALLPLFAERHRETGETKEMQIKGRLQVDVSKKEHENGNLGLGSKR